LSTPRLLNLVAELTYRCPLRCAYCSNPLDFASVEECLGAEDWRAAFRQAAGLGALHVGLSGGEPTARRDLPEIVEAAAGAGLYAHLVTAGVGRALRILPELRARGLRSVQLSIQDVDDEGARWIAGRSHREEKLSFARRVRELGLPLVLNAVLHRRNLGRVRRFVELARELGAERLELANTQYHGFALLNRGALLPRPGQLAEAAAVVAEERARGGIEIVFVLPDLLAGRPKPCMGGWGRKTAVVRPDGLVLPCHAATSIPGLEFWSVKERGLVACWEEAPGMNAFRGEAWMRAPCAGCDQRHRDFGGCRCQAFALTGDAAVADPACALSPHHPAVLRLREEALREPSPEPRLRGPDASSSSAPGAVARSFSRQS